MNILYHFRTRGTGAEGVHIAGIARAFEKLGHEIVFSSPTGIDPRRTAGRNPYGGAGRHGLWSRLARRCPPVFFELLEIAYNLPAFFRNRRLLRQKKCDAIYERHAFFLCSTAWLARLWKVPLIVEVNELVGDERVRAQPFLVGLARWCDRLIFRAAKLIVVVSPHLRRRIIEQGIAAEKVLVLPNAVAREDYENPPDGAEVRRRYGLQDVVVIGFVGWFVAWHRLDLLMEALASLPKDTEPWKLLLVGDGELRESLASRARELGMQNEVVFAGSVAHSEIPAHIAAMDICVVPHSNEYRSPIKLFEYMALGRAVVAPCTEPILSVLGDGECGLVFEPLSGAGLAAQLARLMGSAELRKQMGEHARTKALAVHTWDKNVETILNHRVSSED